MNAPDAPRRLVVDGEVFDVRPAADDNGVHFDWVSGPNPGYGFSSGAPIVFVPEGHPPVAAPLVDDAQLTASIRTFLAQIDPATGYVAD